MKWFKRRHTSAALSGRALWWPLPRAEAWLKPWAVLSDHFMVKKCLDQRTICLRARSSSHPTLNPEEMPVLAANATNRLPALFGFADGITDVSKLVRGLEDRASRGAWECGRRLGLGSIMQEKPTRAQRFMNLNCGGFDVLRRRFRERKAGHPRGSAWRVP
jgi:hypothetical protein